MGLYDEEDDGFNVKMMPKPGTRGQEAGQMTDQDLQRAQTTRGALGQSGMDQRNAQQGWEDALRNNIGKPIENTMTPVVKKMDEMLGFMRPEEPKRPNPLGEGSQAPSQSSQDLYELMMNERSKLVEQGLDPNAPENLQRFQRLRESFLKQRGG